MVRLHEPAGVIFGPRVYYGDLTHYLIIVGAHPTTILKAYWRVGAHRAIICPFLQ